MDRGQSSGARRVLSQPRSATWNEPARSGPGALVAMHVLVVDNDVKMAALLRRGLVEEGLAVDVARTGDDAIWMAATTKYDAIVLDVVLPGADGFAVCRRLRESGERAAVLMLTARDTLEDRVAGLDAGADDYLTKPFSFAELLARLYALARPPGRIA